ncbi:unnamed protein product [Brassica oleracea var. botrytis]
MSLCLVFLRSACDFLTDFRTMAEVFCVCRQWSSKESLMWEFNVDKNRNASFIYTKEDLQYENLMKMVSKDCSIKEEEICLSYGISLDLKSIVEVFLPNLHRKYLTAHKFYRQD